MVCSYLGKYLDLLSKSTLLSLFKYLPLYEHNASVATLLWHLTISSWAERSHIFLASRGFLDFFHYHNRGTMSPPRYKQPPHQSGERARWLLTKGQGSELGLFFGMHSQAGYCRCCLFWVLSKCTETHLGILKATKYPQITTIQLSLIKIQI